jgi:3-phenylpropionate/trans-cinnamate dioxygenase ferredoxin reductase subunit
VTASQTHVIVGASLAGATAAETLRTEGFDGRVVLIGAEPHRPYERPPLSKQVLRGEADPGSTAVHPASFYEDHGIELRLGTRVRAIDVPAALVELDDGRAIQYDRLLLATGSRPRRLTTPGADLDGVHYLRTIDDAAALHAAVGLGTRVAVIGAGWIGSEVAASLRQTGAEVTVVDPQPTPLHAVLGPEVGAVYRDLHREHGVELRLGTGVDRIAGSRSGAVSAVHTTDGTVIGTDVVVVGVGATPRTELAGEAGLALDWGVAVDEHLETSAPGVFAAGDVAAAWHPTLAWRLRVEHWANAKNQGALAARNMLGAGLAYDRLPYFFSDQYDLGMEYSGYAPAWDRVVFRGDPAAREFIAFWLAEGRVLAAMNANVWDVVDPLQALIASKRQVDPTALADPGVPLADLAGAGTSTR